MSSTPSILWFRKDLRLRDNSALKASIEAGLPVIPVFIWSPDEAGDWAPGAASKWWLHQALKSLSEAFKDRGGEFVLREGDSLGQLRDIIEKTGAKRVYWNRRYESPQRELDASIKRQLREDGIEVESFNSSLLNEPHTAATGGEAARRRREPRLGHDGGRLGGRAAAKTQRRRGRTMRSRGEEGEGDEPHRHA